MSYLICGGDATSCDRYRCRRLLAAGVVAVLCAVTMGCFSSPRQEEPPEETPLTDFDPGVTLNISAGFFNSRLLFTNQSSVRLERILVVVNENEGEKEFRGEISGLQPNSMLHFSSTIFVNSAGEKLDASPANLNSVTVYADTPEGRGRWSGSY